MALMTGAEPRPPPSEEPNTTAFSNDDLRANSQEVGDPGGCGRGGVRLSLSQGWGA